MSHRYTGTNCAQRSGREKLLTFIHNWWKRISRVKNYASDLERQYQLWAGLHPDRGLSGHAFGIVKFSAAAPNRP